MTPRTAPFSACTFVKPGQSLEAGLSDVRALGVDTADFGLGNHVAHEPIDVVISNPVERGRAFAGAAKNTGLRLSQALLVNLGESTNHPDPAVRERINDDFPRLLEFLVEAGAESVMVTAGPRHPEAAWDDCFAWAVDGLSRYTRIAEDSGVKVCLEPDVDSFLRSPDEALRLLNAVPSLGLTLDLSHFICRSIPQSAVDCLLPRADLVHIRQASQGLIVDHWNEGSIDFPRLVQQLEFLGYQGEYCVEYLGVPPTLALGIDPHQENATTLQGMREIFRAHLADSSR